MGVLNEQTDPLPGISVRDGMGDSIRASRSLDYRYNPFRDGRFESTPVVVSSDRSFISSLAYQTLLYSYKYGVPYEQGVEKMWSMYKELIQSRKLLLPSAIFLTLPKNIKPVRPSSAEIPEDFEVLPEDSEGERDMFENIFDPESKEENEYWMYATVVDVLRRSGDFPPIIVLENDPTGATNTLRPHVALCTAIAHQCMYGEMDLENRPGHVV